MAARSRTTPAAIRVTISQVSMDVPFSALHSGRRHGCVGQYSDGVNEEHCPLRSRAIPRDCVAYPHLLCLAKKGRGQTMSDSSVNGQVPPLENGDRLTRAEFER